MENNVVTKGEWAPVFTDGKCVGIGVVSGNAFSQIICTSIWPDTDLEYALVQKELEGDMRLLAASKEMYKILQELIQFYVTGTNPYIGRSIFDRSVDIVKKIDI